MERETDGSSPSPQVADSHETPAGSGMGQWARDYEEDLRRFLLKRRIIESDIKDVCQEVYLRMLRFTRTEVLQNPQAYIFRVAANVAHDFRLRRARSGEMPSSHEEERQAAPSAEDLVEAANRKRSLLRELSALPPLPRAAIGLQYQESLTYAEIAERLGVTRRVVQRAIVRGYALMREALRKDV